MHGSQLAGRQLLVGAKEAGAGSLLAALTSRWRPSCGSLALVSPIAAPYFSGLPVSLRVCDDASNVKEALRMIRAVEPDCVVVGASAGPSIEKTLIRASRETQTRVVSFVDHYWNLWQRFAHEETAEKWFYLPDRIFVPAPSAVTRMIRCGAPADRVQSFEHPFLAVPRNRESSSFSARLRGELGLPASAFAVLFVSEYLYPASAVWQWDQPDERDVTGLLREVLDAAGVASSEFARPVVVLVKLHPADGDSRRAVCAAYPEHLYRVVGDVDKAALFAAADIAFGLNSMLLLEACCAGVPCYSHHQVDTDRSTWLSTIHPEIVELGDAGGIADAIRRHALKLPCAG